MELIDLENCCPWHHVMKMYGGSEDKVTRILKRGTSLRRAVQLERECTATKGAEWYLSIES
jgi:hypothetical protein